MEIIGIDTVDIIFSYCGCKALSKFRLVCKEYYTFVEQYINSLIVCHNKESRNYGLKTVRKIIKLGKWKYMSIEMYRGSWRTVFKISYTGLRVFEFYYSKTVTLDRPLVIWAYDLNIKVDISDIMKCGKSLILKYLVENQKLISEPDLKGNILTVNKKTFKYNFMSEEEYTKYLKGKDIRDIYIFLNQRIPIFLE